MTAINDFYLTKHGRACHMDLGDVPQFMQLGFNAFDKSSQFVAQFFEQLKFVQSKINPYNHGFNTSLEEEIKHKALQTDFINNENSNKNSNENNFSLNLQSLNTDLKSKVRTFKTTTQSHIDSVLQSFPLKNKFKLKSFKNLSLNNKDLMKVVGIGAVSLSLLGTGSAYLYNYTTQLNNTSNDYVSSYEENSDNGTNINSVDNDVVQYHMLSSLFQSKDEAFRKLLFITEGESKVFYKDNSGIATLYGWNPTKNSKEFNLQLAKELGLNKKERDAIEAISANPSIQDVPANLKGIVFSKWHLKKSVHFMLNFYEQEFFKVLKVKANEKNKDYDTLLEQYEELPFNQQAVLIHMIYKVGATNLLKYNQFFDTLFAYMDNPSSRHLKDISKSFEYSYKTRNGDILRDTRIEKKHESFFSDCLNDQPQKPLSKNNHNTDKETIALQEKTHKENVETSIAACRQLVAQGEVKNIKKTKKNSA